MIEHRRKLKSLKKLCQDCGGKLSLYLYEKDCNGVVYDEQWEECEDCGFRSKVKLSEKRQLGDSWRYTPTKF
jgi:hypothetical protein